MVKTYSNLILLHSFISRFNYLKINSKIGEETFGSLRYLNQRFYTSKEWRDFRRDIILRDNGCDLGISDNPITGNIIIHHIEPISPKDLLNSTACLMDPDNVICVSLNTHNAIHYGSSQLLDSGILVVRTPNDTTPWKG